MHREVLYSFQLGVGVVARAVDSLARKIVFKSHRGGILAECGILARETEVLVSLLEILNVCVNVVRERRVCILGSIRTRGRDHVESEISGGNSAVAVVGPAVRHEERKRLARDSHREHPVGRSVVVTSHESDRAEKCNYKQRNNPLDHF